MIKEDKNKTEQKLPERHRGNTLLPVIRDLLINTILSMTLTLGVLLVKVKKIKTNWFTVFILFNSCGKSYCLGSHIRKYFTADLLKTELFYKLTF